MTAPRRIETPRLRSACRCPCGRPASRRSERVARCTAFPPRCSSRCSRRNRTLDRDPRPAALQPCRSTPRVEAPSSTARPATSRASTLSGYSCEDAASSTRAATCGARWPRSPRPRVRRGRRLSMEPAQHPAAHLATLPVRPRGRLLTDRLHAFADRAGEVDRSVGGAFAVPGRRLRCLAIGGGRTRSRVTADGRSLSSLPSISSPSVSSTLPVRISRTRCSNSADQLSFHCSGDRSASSSGSRLWSNRAASLPRSASGSCSA